MKTYIIVDKKYKNEWDIIFRVGMTYEFKGEVGIDSCKLPFFYNLDEVRGLDANTSILMEVEVLGDIIEGVYINNTNKLKVLREIPVSEWNDLSDYVKYNEDGVLIYRKNRYNGNECWWEYDGNSVFYKDSMGNEYRHESKLDENGNIIFSKVGNYELHQEYDDRGNLLSSKDGQNTYSYKYDERNNKIYQNRNGDECWWEYNDNGDKVYEKFGSTVVVFSYKYDDRGNIIYAENNHDNKEWFEYDENNNLIYYENNDGDKYWRRYDENGLVYEKNVYGKLEYYKYEINVY